MKRILSAFLALLLILPGYCFAGWMGGGGAASTSQAGLVQLSNSYEGTSQVKAATEKAVSDGLATKQNTGSYEASSNKVTSLSSGSTDVQYPSAKLVYDQLAGKQASGSYAPATSGSSILKGDGAGGFSAASPGTDYAAPTSGSSILKGNGSGGFTAATAGVDYATPGASATSWQNAVLDKDVQEAPGSPSAGQRYLVAVRNTGLAGWGYRKTITITGSAGSGTDYQVKLLIGETSGATGENFDLEGHSLDFPTAEDSGDLRFTAADHTTLLPMYVESVTGTTPNRLVTVWVKVGANLDNNVNIDCYYGKASAANVSSGSSTFIFFDDFEDGLVPARYSGGTLTAATGISGGQGTYVLRRETNGGIQISLGSSMTEGSLECRGKLLNGGYTNSNTNAWKVDSTTRGLLYNYSSGVSNAWGKIRMWWYGQERYGITGATQSNTTSTYTPNGVVPIYNDTSPDRIEFLDIVFLRKYNSAGTEPAYNTAAAETAGAFQGADAWNGYDKYIAEYGTTWTFTAPAAGMKVYVTDEKITYIYNGTSWVNPNGSLSAYAAGTAYTLTATPALCDFGTTDPTLTITVPGTYLILSRARIEYTGATFAASKAITLKLRRTNNTAADLAGASAVFNTAIVTTVTQTAGVVPLPPVIYTTANSDDIVQLWGSIAELPAAGSVDIAAGEVVAVRLY